MVIAFLIVFAAVLGGGYFLVQYLRKKRLDERKRLSEVARALDRSPVRAPTSRKTTATSDQAATSETATSETAPGQSGNGPGSENTGGEGNQDAKPAVKPKVPMTKAWTNLVSLLREQAMAVYASVIEAAALDSELFQAKEELESAIRDKGRSPVLPHSSNLDEIEKSIKESGEPVKRERKAFAIIVEKTPASKAATEKAQADWEALTLSLRRVDLDDLASIPDEALPVVLAANKVRLWAKGDIEAYAERAAKRLAPKPRSKGPSLAKIEDALADMTRKLVDTLQYRSDKLVGVHSEASNLVSAADQFEEWTAREPNKPTAEDVGRYLQETEDWATRRLAAQRAAVEALTAYVPNRKTYEKMLADLGRAVDKLKYILATTVDEEAEALVSAAFRMHARMDSRFREAHSDVDKWLARDFDRSKPVYVTTPEQDEEIKALRQMARTLGFAVAQRNVAWVKHSQAKGKSRPYEPSEPRVSSREFDFEALAGSFKSYLAEVASNAVTNEQIDAEIEVIGNALEARQAKVKQTAELLSAKSKGAVKKMDDETADETRIVAAFAAKLCAHQGVG